VIVTIVASSGRRRCAALCAVCSSAPRLAPSRRRPLASRRAELLAELRAMLRHAVARCRAVAAPAPLRHARPDATRSLARPSTQPSGPSIFLSGGRGRRGVSPLARLGAAHEARRGTTARRTARQQAGWQAAGQHGGQARWQTSEVRRAARRPGGGGAACFGLPACLARRTDRPVPTDYELCSPGVDQGYCERVARARRYSQFCRAIFSVLQPN